MPRDLLFVDDDKLFLSQLQLLIRQNLGLEPFTAEMGSDALAVTRLFPIKVLIADQEMPGMAGTDLIRKVKDEGRTQTRCILLTGHSSRVDVADAANLGLFRFVKKEETTTLLLPAVREAIYSFDLESAATSGVVADARVMAERALIKFNTKVTVDVVKVMSVVTPYVRDHEWGTDYSAQRGIEQSKQIEIEKSAMSSIESQVDREVLAKTRVDLAKLIGGLETSLQGRVALSQRASATQTTIVKARESLTVKEITDPREADGRLLQSREYQSAPVYVRANCGLQIDCSCCQMLNHPTISIDILTDRIALRQVEHYDDGTQTVIYTGFLEGRPRA